MRPASTSPSSSRRPGSPPTAIPSACTRWSRTCSRTPCATRPPAGGWRSGRGARPTGAPPVAAPRSTVTIEVCDEGPGIAEVEEARVFERFYRVDTARASSDGGAGLGLAIAQWIVDLHGGDIHSERREPHGCRMVVTLPGAAAQPEQVPN